MTGEKSFPKQADAGKPENPETKGKTESVPVGEFPLSTSDCHLFRPFIPKDWKALAIFGALLAVFPLFIGNDYFLLLMNIMALNALVVLGLNLLIGSTGQVSMGHAAFYGIGAYVSAYASTIWQWPTAGALLLAVLFVACTAFLIAVPTLRLEGHYLVMATLGFNIIVTILFTQMESITGGPSGFAGIPRMEVAGIVLDTDRSFYYFIWGIFLLAFALTLNFTDSRMGRALMAIHEKELTAQALGIPTQRYKVATFVLSAVYAGIAGFCYAHYVTFISPKTFDIFYSVQVVTMVVIGGMGSLWGGLAGVVVITCLPDLLRGFQDLYVLTYGLILMTVLVFCPKGLLPFVKDVLGRMFPKLSGKKNALPPPDKGRCDLPFSQRNQEELPGFPAPRSPHPDISPVGTRPLLELKGIGVNFGGVSALQSVDMQVFPGEVVGLIGPNGAGKTTLLNVISGLLNPQSGDLLLEDKNIQGLPPHRIAALGIGRTFQAVQIYQHLSVMENVLMGYHLQGRSGFLSTSLHSPGERREERALRDQAMNLLDHFGLGQKALASSQELCLLEQKLVELVRAVASKPSVLLMDEPVGGLNPRESEELARHVQALRRRGMGIILVEHDMNVVMKLTDRIVVLQHGCRIATGTPREIQQDSRVIEAYLGRRRD